MRAQNPEQSRRATRIISVIAATFIALSCGTNYAYSAWSPQFAVRLALTATEVNLIGNAANVGMYGMGIPGGILIDAKGPRYGVLAGSLALAVGYFPLRWAYLHGPGSMSVLVMCFFSLLTGVGSCTAFTAALKVCTTNWPRHRGTATALPLSAFGLSALFYTTVAHLALPHDTAGYLLILACGTTIMVFVGMFFLQIVRPNTPYQRLADHESRFRARKDSNPLHQTIPPRPTAATNADDDDGPEEDPNTISESSSLVPSDSSGPGDITPTLNQPQHHHHHHHDPHKPEVTGLQLFRVPKFWHLFIMLSLLSGVGLMTINNIGNSARALWHHHDPSASREFLQRRQLVHVSVLSALSFLGRLASGIGSDWLVHHSASRFWTLVAAAVVFATAQLVGFLLVDPRHLYWLSALTGLAYGALYGVFPALVADSFGASGMGINWGIITLAPILTGNAFNLVYGAVLDGHSRFENPGTGTGAAAGGGVGERVCDLGRECYAEAYVVTLVSSAVGILWSLWCIRLEHKEKTARSVEEGGNS